MLYSQGYVSKIIGKLKLTKLGWTVPANLTDTETGENLEIQFSDQVKKKILDLLFFIT